MEARARVAPVGEPVAIEVPEVVEAPGEAVVARRRAPATGRSRQRAVARPIVLTRDEEYRFIRSDLNRLLITASALLLVMVVLLVAIEV